MSGEEIAGGKGRNHGMSDLGVLVPILTPSGTSGTIPAPSAQPSPRPAERVSASARAPAETPVDPITGQRTAALSAGLALVLQDADTGTALQGNAAPQPPQEGSETPEFRPVDPVEAAVEALTDPTAAQEAGTAVAGNARAPDAQPAAEQDTNTPQRQGDEAEAAPQSSAEDVGPDGLTEEERRIVAELQRVDAEIRRHEQAHAAVGGPYAGAPAYQTVRGPDGRLYAVGGEVQIDVSDIPGNPEATIRKLQVVRRAALAPTTPSAADRRVASIAQQGIAEARQELRDQRIEEREAASETREGSAVRREQLQPTDGLGAPNPAADLTPLRLGIPTLVRASGPFVNPSQILSVIA